MGHRFAEIAFTPEVREMQSNAGSRAGYAAMEQGDSYNHRLGEREAAFIAARDSCYMASVGETGWPYVQHRGGPVGFIKVLDATTLGFADYSGNRQYVSTGNFRGDDRVALFFMDYPNRTRLKLLGRVEVLAEDDPRLEKLEDADYRASIERALMIRVEAFDWNCPQHITPRYSEAEVAGLMAPLVADNERLRRAAGDEEADPGSATPMGDGELKLVISGVRQLTPRVRAYELRHPDGLDLPPVAAGAHLQVPVRLADGSLGQRHYSIASNPARRDIYEIAVLRDGQGGGGSRALQQGYRLGMPLRTTLPANHFRLHDDDRPALLIAGGIGITPLKAMAQALLARGTPFELHYAGRSLAEMPYRDRLQRALGDRLRLYPSDRGERLNITPLLAAAPAEAQVYVCGPTRLIDAVIEQAAGSGIDRQRVRFERFDAGIDADARPIRVELARSAKVIDVGTDESILDAMLAAGVDAPHSCKRGNCRACAVRVLEGDAEHRDAALAADERAGQRLMCPCVSRARGEALVLDI